MPEQGAAAQQEKPGLVPNLSRHRNLIMIWTIFAVLAIAAAVASPPFRTSRNITNVMVQAAALGTVAAGQTVAVVHGGVDISVGSLISVLVGIASYTLTSTGAPVLLTMFYFVVVAGAVGALNGLGAGKLRLPPFVLTLGVMTLLQGVALLLRPQPGGQIAYDFTKAVSGKVGVVPIPTLVWLATALVVGLIMGATRFGRYLYAVGGNEEGTRLSGINVNLVKLGAYLVTSLTAAVGAVLVAGRIGSGDPLVGVPFGLDSVTAVVLGGARLEGGRGGVAGTVAGTLIVAMLSNILNLLKISTNYQYVLKGAILILAVFFYSTGRGAGRK